MKNRYDKLIAMFISLIIIILSFNFVIKPKNEFSENENRYLETFPKYTLKKLFKGNFIADLESYFNDQFPNRDKYVSLKTKTELLLGKKEINDVIVAKNNTLIENYNKPTNSDLIIENFNNFYKEINHINLNLMLVPTSLSINFDLLPKNIPTYNQVETINYIYSKIKFNYIDVYETLKEGNKKYPMFYRLDHHWTSYGAYYAYLKYASLNELVPLKITDFNIKKFKDFEGTLYSKTGIYDYEADTINLFLKDNDLEVNYVASKTKTNSLYDYSYLDKKDKYSVFLSNNHPLIEIKNNRVNNGKRLLIIKDSYANAIVPFLINHYESISLIDPRFYKDSVVDYIFENKITDGLILYNINYIDKDKDILLID